jgi:Dolichyl-phosphate-mannose-protein mannosyltransferase
MSPSEESARGARGALALIVAGFLLLALAYSMVIPLGEGADEVSHFAYLETLRQKHQLPGAEGEAAGEAHQPPLYYLISALLLTPLPQGEFGVIANPDFELRNPQTPNLLLHTQREAFPYQGEPLVWHLARGLSILCAALTVWVTAQIAFELSPEQLWLGLGAAGFIAFLPAFISLGAIVNNDNLIILLAALVCWQVVRLVQRGLNWRTTITLGVLLALIALTKLNGLLLWIWVPVVILWNAYRSNQWALSLKHLALCFGLAILLVAPWAIYNQTTYGDPLGLALYFQVGTLRQTPLQLSDWLRIAQEVFTSFWGRFGGALQLRFPDALYLALGLVGALALGGWIFYAQDARRRALSPGARVLFGLAGSLWLLIAAAYMRWAISDEGAGQARQLFIGLPMLAVFLSAGIARVSMRMPTLTLRAWSAAWALAAIGGLLFLYTTFDSRPTSGAIATESSTDFAQTIRLVNYSVYPVRVMPGDSIRFDLTWQALVNHPSRDYWFLIQLVGSQEPVAHKEGIPGAGRATTDWWEKGQIYSATHRLDVPQDAPPGEYSVQIGVHPFGEWDWLAVRGKEMSSLGNITIAAP